MNRRSHEGDLWDAGVVLSPDLSTGCRDGITLWKFIELYIFFCTFFLRAFQQKNLIKILI